MAEIIQSTPENISKAIHALENSLVVAIPTETVYGLSAHAFDPDAVLKVFKTKNRPHFDPLIVHIGTQTQNLSFKRVELPLDFIQLYELIEPKHLSLKAKERINLLARTFWPGPLTLVLPKSNKLPDLVTSGLDSVAIRMPSHPVAQLLLNQSQMPLVAPSANRFGRVSPTMASAVQSEFKEEDFLILDGDDCSIGLESTVIKVSTNGEVILLRPGAITREQIEELLEIKCTLPQTSLIQAPGQLDSHYCPEKPLYRLQEADHLLKSALKDKPDLLSAIGYLSFERDEKKARTEITNRLEYLFPDITSHCEPIILLPHTRPDHVAKNLFSSFRKLDESDIKIIMVDDFPTTDGIGLAIQDRIKRASTKIPLTLNPQSSVDLHAHLFMSEGLGLLFRGSFQSKIKARSWKSRFSSKANAETLNQSELGLVVSTCYAHPALKKDMRESVRRQIDQANHFVKSHPEWMIARNSAEAKRAYESGQRIMLLALEGASGIIETDEDIQEFIVDKGIRIVTLCHFLDDQFGGAAFLKNKNGFLANPKAYLKAKLKKSKSHGVISNPNGLTSFGEQFVHKMMQHKVWIDLAHSSDETQKTLISLHQNKNLPLLYTHTVLRKHHLAERALNTEQLSAVKTLKGIIGLMPCDEMLIGTPTSSDSDHSLGRFKVHYDEVASQIGQNSTLIGSDFNGGIGQIGGCCSQTASKEFQKKGLAHIGMLPEFWKALREHSSMVPQELTVTVENFIQTWQNYESHCSS